MKSSAKILSLVLTLALALAVFAPAAMAKTYVTEKSNNFHFTGVKRPRRGSDRRGSRR